jgi:hypothetical protein
MRGLVLSLFPGLDLLAALRGWTIAPPEAP